MSDCTGSWTTKVWSALIVFQYETFRTFRPFIDWYTHVEVTQVSFWAALVSKTYLVASSFETFETFLAWIVFITVSDRRSFAKSMKTNFIMITIMGGSTSSFIGFFTWSLIWWTSDNVLILVRWSYACAVLTFVTDTIVTWWTLDGIVADYFWIR